MLRVALFFVLLGPLGAGAQTNLAHGFSKLPAGASVVVMAADIELFEISTGGVSEPRADWTEIAERHVTQGLRARKARLGAQVKDFEQGNDEAIAALLRLYRAVSEAVVAARAFWRQALPHVLHRAEVLLLRQAPRRGAGDRRFRPAQDPRNRGFRFSMKARRPSA